MLLADLSGMTWFDHVVTAAAMALYGVFVLLCALGALLGLYRLFGGR